MPENDTICAPATAVGKAGICIVRISGPEAHKILDRIFKPSGSADMIPRMLVLGDVHDGDTVIDRALAVKFRAPHSFTGEDVSEIHAHGGDMTSRLIMKAAVNAGASVAEPGEFSKRAFLNGKIDLSQAESIQDLIGSISEKSAEISARNMRGDLYDKICSLQDDLKNVLASMQAGIEYPEEDLEDEITAAELPVAERIADELEKLCGTYDTGIVVKEGVPVAIAGSTNVGKSSLLNALVGREMAIVTDIPGTTRDVLSETINISGIPVILYDTAGFRETSDKVEKIGVERAYHTIDDASFVLFLFDASRKTSEEEKSLFREIVSRRKTVVPVLNKTDIVQEVTESDIMNIAGIKPLKISALTGEGIEALSGKIRELALPDPSLLEGVVITNARHQNALKRAYYFMNDAIKAMREGISLDCVTIDLSSAWESLGEITGETLTEDIIDRIFEKFCLGK